MQIYLRVPRVQKVDSNEIKNIFDPRGIHSFCFCVFSNYFFTTVTDIINPYVTDCKEKRSTLITENTKMCVMEKQKRHMVAMTGN